MKRFQLIFKRYLGILVLSVLPAVGCTLILDTDVLQNDSKQTGDTETGTAVQECQSDSDCVDAFDCTSDWCNDNDQCVHTADDSLCGQYEECDAAAGCTPTGQDCEKTADCDDTVDCTIDQCADGVCHHSPIHTLCENSVPFCRESARCVPDSGGCVEGSVIKCDQPSDGICVTATCNESNGVCETHLSAGADKDSDSSLDALCGGDDCNDTDATSYPGAVEICDLADNDCDGIVDASFDDDDTITIVESTGISDSRVAVNGSDVAVLWTDTAGLKATVVNSEGVMLSYDFANLHALTTSMGRIVASAVETGVFYVAFTEAADGTAVTLQVVKLTVNSTGDALEASLDASLDHQLTTTISDLDIKFDGLRTDSGWMVLWSENDDTSGDVRFQSHDMSAAISVNSGTGSAESVSLGVTGAAAYSAVYAADFPADAGNNVEIFLSQIHDDTGFSVTGSLLLISSADNDNQGGDDDDPSLIPAADANPSTGDEAVAWLDYTGFGNLKNVSIWSRDTLEISDLLASATLESIFDIRVRRDANNVAVVYLRQSSTIARIVLDQLIPSTVADQGYERLAQLELKAVAYPETTFSGLDAVSNTDGRLAVVWIEETASATRLQLATAVGGCTKDAI